MTFIQYSILTLLFLVLANGLILPPSLQSLEATTPQPLKKRQSRTNAQIVGGNIGKGNSGFCKDSQVQRITADLKWMHELAGAASDFLLQPDSHTTAAYIAWFGESYASATRATEIGNKVFKSIWNMGLRSVRYTESVEDGSYNAIVFGCFPTDPQYCTANTYAVARDNRYSYVMVCPSYFGLSQKYTEAFASWRDKREDIDVGGQILLHEMLHQRIVVGADYYAHDYAYRPDNCLSLPDWKKKGNAENYALFALEVKANPERAKLQVDLRAPEGAGENAKRLLKPSN
ncbi:24 kda metalloproteinase [Colletotrichum graminicola]|nr:24 kda metalloproteinase [Colletotrichum graminicola]